MQKKIPNSIDVHVGGRIRFRRTMLGLSQEKLGDSLGITFQQVQKYEKGTNRVGASRLQNIASILGVPISFFFEETTVAGADAPNEITDISLFISSSEGLALNRAFMSIPDPAVRQSIVKLAKSVAKNEGLKGASE
ncbi:helix-turn-helix domain-containing protein [Pararhizobium sp. BT-229]|nr:helix-turn-helix transcriptional regulator [Pararhizobium sp. BT-229]MCV9963208.1 helix-turn-helix domain-containing protein [Pararhizobium sp. BT-229]